MLNMREIIDYGLCYVVAINCPADGIDLLRKATLFDVCEDGTHETLDTFHTARQAKKFSRRYIADPTGSVQQRRQLSADRIIHTRALWAVALLGNYSEFDVTISNKRNPQATPERYEVNDIFPTAAENQIVILYYPNNEATSVDHMYLSGIKAVRAISKNSFAFETYQGKVYTISGKDW